MRSAFALWLVAASVVWATYWMEDIRRQGIAPFNSDKDYRIFRNVKDWGAKGDGGMHTDVLAENSADCCLVTDDTAAINNIISDGNRCGGPGCVGSTTTPAIIYFPPGTYIISTPIVSFYYTQIIGDPTHMPVIKASRNFPTKAIAMLDADPYMDSGSMSPLAAHLDLLLTKA
jgi:hypothetical protein